MAKFKSSPFYSVQSGNVKIDFDVFGVYETNDKTESEILDSLCPVWVTCIDKSDKVETKQPEAPAPAPRKPSAK
jgi:hypothetical protein